MPPRHRFRTSRSTFPEGALGHSHPGLSLKLADFASQAPPFAITWADSDGKSLK